MSTLIQTTQLLKQRLFERLKEARRRLGLKQSELAEIGQVSRATQISYESDITAPNTNYLRLVQGAGLDISFLLFDKEEGTSEEASSAATVDWKILQEAFDEVEFFCIKAAPNCPSSYRWQLIQRVYSELTALQLTRRTTSPVKSSQEIVRNVWETT